jgi:hypothetical protein
LDFVFSSCAISLNFWEAHLLKVLLPYIFLAALLSIGTFSYVLQKRNNPNVFRNRHLANPIERALSIYVQIMIGLTTFVVMVGFSPFRCYNQMDGSFSLIPSSDLSCFDEVWWSYSAVTVIGLLQIICCHRFFSLSSGGIAEISPTTGFSGHLEC